MPGRQPATTPKPAPKPAPGDRPFFGPWVVRATFAMATLGWGVGFYGPPIFLHAVGQRTGWSLAIVSTAVTLHFLFGALVVTRLTGLHRRFGVGPTALVGAGGAALGVLGWSLAAAPWQLFASALFSGGGWVCMGAYAVNAAIAPWFVRTRPMALAKAYNGASVGGMVFSPLWVLLIERWGFSGAAAALGGFTVVLMALLSWAVFSKTPAQFGQLPDGDAPGPASPAATADPSQPAVAGPAPATRSLWRNRQFVTLAAGMAIGLFAQIGVLAHLYALLAPVLGTRAAGMTLALATACAMAGRVLVAKALPPGADRRLAAALAYGVQLAGLAVLALAEPAQTGLILLGVVLFGSGIGNATSLPPLIAQVEFDGPQVARVVALIVASAQASYAFAPAVFGLVLAAGATGAAISPRIGEGSGGLLFTAALCQCLAIAAFLAGRSRA